MFRVLLDHNVPANLRRYLDEQQVRTTEEDGWGQIPNGALIQSAEVAGYQVLVTCDQNRDCATAAQTTPAWIVDLRDGYCGCSHGSKRLYPRECGRLH